jgi:hypothetical protein
MKKLFLLLLLFVPAWASAQFKVVPGGMTTENGREYIVENFNGSQSELSVKAKAVLTKMFASPQDTIEAADSSSITLKTCAMKVVHISYCGKPLDSSIIYHLTFRFKDGKIRIDTPQLLSYFYANYAKAAPTSQMLLEKGYKLDKKDKAEKSVTKRGMAKNFYVYKLDGSTRIDDAVTGLEEYFNTLVKKFVNEMDLAGSKDEW